MTQAKQIASARERLIVLVCRAYARTILTDYEADDKVESALDDLERLGCSREAELSRALAINEFADCFQKAKSKSDIDAAISRSTTVS